MKRIIKNILLLLFCFIISFTEIYHSYALDKKDIKLSSLSTNITELIFKLKQKDKLVGRTSACDYITGTEKITIIGDLGIPNIEKLLLTKTNIVITSLIKDPFIEKTINDVGIKFVYAPIKTIQEYINTIKIIGKILQIEDIADNEIRSIQQKLNNFIQKQKLLKKRPKILVIMTQEFPIITAGKTSFLTDIINYAGGINMGAIINKDYPEISQEWILQQNPDIIIAPNLSKNTIKYLKNNKFWKEITAIKNNKIYTNIDPNFLYVIGPNIIKLIKYINDKIINN